MCLVILAIHVYCLVFPSENEFDSHGVVRTGIMNLAKSGEAIDSRLLEDRPREKYGHSDATDSR